MKRIVILFVFLALTGWITSCEQQQDPKPDLKPEELQVSAETRQLIEADNHFGIELFKQVVAGQKSSANTMISPVSIALALAMTYNGAEGDTKAAMEEALQLTGLSRQEINASYQALIEALLTVDPKVTMEIANSIWYRQEFSVEQDFLDVNREYYDAEVNALDFNSSEAPSVINNWVSDRTNGKITKIIEQIDPLTMMYLINAIYFNGKWKFQFDEDKTSRQPFYMADGSEIQTDMMQTEATLNYMRNDLFRAVEMPYGRGNYTMVCMLPNEELKVEDVVGEMNAENWNQWMQAMDSAGVQVHLPRFKFEYEKKLNELLQAMGMEEAFDPYESDFSGINPDRDDLHISEVMHKTFIEVDEKGTEAAAVTSVTMSTTSADPGGPVVVKFDKPFVFAIREVTTGTIVFVGKVVEP
ncbi:MAG TPA: serpin family protein [Bacteroidales bacterium]|nr:serpin family protein [Bacteroidales bacterium]